MSERAAWWWLAGGWAVALMATTGAVLVGEILGQTPCSLCWYQRIFMFPLVWILGVASYRSDFAVWRYALPLAVVGGGFAVYHSLLYWRWIEPAIVPCSAEASCSGANMLMFGIVPLPGLSAAAFLIVVLSLTFVRRYTRS
ncbi:disulfide bond formation protein B [Achromobacter sp. GG226]|uniref:disulfide bond formation protein B n=1 Tax=Verticiella alkaliphila TaxID=2779529 RepID=UPI001C0C4E2E|nr:disulfide bond formation protein B [Verticiella sp. GG226]MBU4610338.1 disulfide bond formation protein B [Verticiella sp. GG226]